MLPQIFSVTKILKAIVKMHRTLDECGVNAGKTLHLRDAGNGELTIKLPCQPSIVCLCILKH